MFDRLQVFKGRVAKLVMGRIEPIYTQPLRLVNLLKSEESRDQIILIVDGPATGETETLSQPQRRLEAGNRSARRSEGLKAADLRHVLLHSEMVALDPLL